MELPFRVRAAAPQHREPIDLDPAGDPDLSLEDLEAAYLRALEASDVAQAAFESPGEERLDGNGNDEPMQPSAARGDHPGSPEPAAKTGLTQQSVLEALLFVGGAALTTRKLAEVLNLRDADAVEPLVQRLNSVYETECRPYLVGFHQGGYRLELRPEFEPVRRKVYGLSPKEVRLSQDALEVLALVAYRQPLSAQDLKLSDRKNAPSLLRQLLRRELVALNRGGDEAKSIFYVTTPRFLQLFGIGSVDELPYPEDLEFK
jgi:segregation and condensation protein B